MPCLRLRKHAFHVPAKSMAAQAQPWHPAAVLELRPLRSFARRFTGAHVAHAVFPLHLRPPEPTIGLRIERDGFGGREMRTRVPLRALVAGVPMSIMLWTGSEISQINHISGRR